MTRRDEPFGGQPRDGMHQPPNPEDIKRVPPGNPDCARVRGMLRDYADRELRGADAAADAARNEDLGDREALQVEEHVHGCRVCAVELARAEHEVMRLRRALLPKQLTSQVPVDFTRKLMNRLVLEGDASDAASVGAGSARAGANGALVARGVTVGRDGKSGRAGLRKNGAIGSPTGMLVAGLFVLFVLGVFARVFAAGDQEPERIARLVVLKASDAFDNQHRPLAPGASVGDEQSIWLKRGGKARVKWHDPTRRSQPAAYIEMQGGELQMKDGAPMLLGGKLVVDAQRDIEVPIADGSGVLLGVGEYVITAEADIPEEMFEWNHEDGASFPADFDIGDLEISVEVLSGEPARILRGGASVAVVAVGQVATSSGSGPIAIGPAGPVAEIDREDQQAPAPVADLAAWVRGHAVDDAGLPSIGAQIYLSYASAEQMRYGARVTGSNGAFALRSDYECDSTFAIVLAAPSPAQDMLGVTAPHAVPLDKQDMAAKLRRPIQFGVSKLAKGVVRDATGQVRGGVQVVPCIVDDLFGQVLALTDQRAMTDEFGAFRIARLPSSLPHHQSLVLLLLHPELATTVAPIPARGSDEAVEDLGVIVAGSLRWVRLSNLPPNTSLTLFEDVPGLPDGCAAVQKVVTSNVFGDVLATQVGSGRLWVRRGAPGSPQLSELTEAAGSQAGIPRYFMQSSAKPYGKLFRLLQPIAGSSLSVANNFRHASFEVSAAAQAATGRALLVVDSLSYSVSGAEVFAVARTGPRGMVDVRFLGFTSQTGAASIATVRPDEDVVVIGPDGALGYITRPSELGFTVTATVHDTGRVNLGADLRLAPLGSPGGSDRWVTLRFERVLDDLMPGMPHTAVRFASHRNAWEVQGLLPGTYTASVHSSAATCYSDSGAEQASPVDGETFTIVVPPNGFVMLGQ